jgi:limonene-1,2-epoxide hydrolase
MAERLNTDRVRAIFNAMNRDNLHLVDELYAPEVLFVDPFHRIQGRDALRDYYRKMYADVQAIRFDFSDATETPADRVLYWTMPYRHPRLGGGKPISLEGCSRLVFADADVGAGVGGDAAGKVILHRDYFDAGALLYEHIPLLGRGIRFIRERV